MKKYQGDVGQVCFVLPKSIDNQLKIKARQIAVDSGVDVAYSDLIMAAVCRYYGMALPSPQSAAVSQAMEGDDV